MAVDVVRSRWESAEEVADRAAGGAGAASPPTGRVGAARLAALLGAWRAGDRASAAELADALRLLVLDGRLPPGTRLPSERELAAATGTSRTLTTAAYDRLRAAGLLASRRGAGSWTTAPSAPRGAHPPVDGGVVDLAHASPPAPPALAAAADAVRPAFGALLATHGYSPRGLPELRALLADRFTERGLPTTPEQVLVTNGAQAAFALVLRALTAPGDRVLVEQPTYPNALDAVRTAHARAVPVALDPRHGWDVEAVDAAVRRAGPALAYLVPEFHNPTGLRMPAEVRAELGAVLRRSRTPVVVDETLVELDLDGHDGDDGSVPPFAATGDQVVTVGSASKAFWGGLRLGWLRAPVDVVGRIVATRPGTDLGCPVFEQLLLAELLRRRAELVAERVAGLRAGRAALLDALAEHLPAWSVRPPSGGLAVWCELDAPGSTRLAVLAAQHGVRLTPGARFGAHGGLERWLRLPYTLPPEQLPAAVARVALAWAAVRAAGSPDDGMA